MNTSGIYSLSLVPHSDHELKSAFSGSMNFSQLGGGFTDVFRKNRAPQPMELIQNLIGTAYACASLNADGVASGTMRLYLTTSGNQSKSHLSRNGKTAPVSTRDLMRLKASPETARFVVGQRQVEEVTTHPFLDCLLHPKTTTEDDATLSYYDLIWMTQMYLESIGRAYWVKITDGLGPASFMLLRSHLVREIPDFSGKKSIIGYQYGGQTFSLDQVTKFHFPDPNNPYAGGYSPMMAGFEQIRLLRKTDAHTNALLDNMGRPDSIWSPKGDSEGGGIGTPEAARMRLAIRQQFAQAGRGGVMISEFPGTLQPLQWAPGDVIELERAKAIKTHICNAFGVPDAKLERNAANLASAQTADYAHAKDAIAPRQRRIADTINKDIMPFYSPDGRLFVAFDSPLPEKTEQTVGYFRNGVQDGSVTKNEYRDLIGLPKVEWGDQPTAPLKMIPIDTQTGEPVPEAGVAKVDGQDNQNGAQSQPAKESTAVTESGKESLSETGTALNGSQIASALQIVQEVAAGRIPRDSGLGQLIQFYGMSRTQAEAVLGSAGRDFKPSDAPDVTAVAEQARDAKQIARRLEKKLRKARRELESLRNPQKKTLARFDGTGASQSSTALAAELKKLFKALGSAVMDKLEAHSKSLDDVQTKTSPPNRPHDGWFDENEWKQQFVTESVKHLMVSATAAASDLATRLQMDGSLLRVVDRNLKTTVNTIAMQFSESTLETTDLKITEAIEQLRGEISEGLFAGDSLGEMRKRVRTVFDEAESWRVDTITRTETSRVVHAAELETARVSPIVEKKQWLASIDCCDKCEEYAARGPIGLNDSFGATGYGPVMAPPDSHPNCACTLTFLVDASQLNL